MITKILFTALVIIVVFAITRFRVQRLKAIPAPAPVVQSRPTSHRNIAYGVIAAIALVAAVLYYLRWSDFHEVVTIRVVNSRTGSCGLGRE